MVLAEELDGLDVGFSREAFGHLPAVEASHFWFVSRNEMIAWLATKFKPEIRRVLEIGCGTGFALYALREAYPTAQISGSELHSEALRTARERHGGSVELIQMDARRMHIEGAIDVIGAFDVLEHIQEDAAVLSQIEEALVPGGLLLATVPQHTWLWSASDDLAHHVRRYRPGELSGKARNAGLDVLYESSFTAILLPLMAIARFIDHGKDTLDLNGLIRKEFELSPLANRVLLGVARIEQIVRRLGIPLPFGGSQVVVAQKPLLAQAKALDGVQ